MALFGSDEKETVQSKKIRPTVLRVQNVAKEILSIAKSNGVKPDTIDFNILEVQTYTRVLRDAQESEWEEISPEEIYELDDTTALLNPHFQIKQMYEVEFFSKKENPVLDGFRAAIGANATKCKIYLSIKEGSKISYRPTLETELTSHINKLKVRAGIFIYIFDEMMDENISKLLAHIRVQEEVVYTKNETILVAESYEPTLTVNDKIILHYDKQVVIDENQRIDYASRGYIKAVKKDELLIEYLKAREGKPGRNCRGEFMAPKEPEENNKPTFSVDDTIRVDDNPKNIEYIANENGYIALDGNVYCIKTEIDMGEISFRTTGNIISGVDSDVNINVAEENFEKDAIGTGMDVEVTEIDVTGNVGSNASLVALRANIDGQTHKTAKVKADKLNINVHKGTAYGRTVHITRLEHGIVDADTVEISQALGGNVKANKINIEICASHVKATASQLIEINKLQGSENIFTIDPLVKRAAKHGLEETHDEIDSAKQDLKEVKKELVKYQDMVKKGTPAFLDIKKRLVHYKKSGIKMPESFVKRYKQFQMTQAKLNSLQESYNFKKNELEILESKTSIYQDDITDARIINKDRWIGYNEIRFKIVEPPIELVYKPQEGSSDKVFGLVEVEDGEYEIQVIKESEE